MRPACGSTSVFQTKAESGSVASGLRLTSVSAGPAPCASPRSSGDGARSTSASSSACMPTFSSDEVGSTGHTLPAITALRRPCASCSCERVPFSKNSSIRSSLLSATISTSFSRHALAASCWAGGISAV